ncbi:MAG: gluconate kinase [Deltaproteobacteria bacterium HGW-Deltaproteobacteria-15]|jgi:gluconokinase|nr:MAG: gluconate kinase [Deltaproteobacteria bacterium HGW-Deltaproteobacteria-15]
MKNGPWFLGIDLGTGSCKSIVVDEKGRVLGFGIGLYGGTDPESRWQEQDPRNLMDAAAVSVQSALTRADVARGGCLGLSMGGALHSILALDSRDNPLTGVITWADGRGLHHAEALRGSTTAIRLYQETGCPVHGMYPLYKIMWLREKRPEVFRATHRYVTAKEYVFSQFTGQFAVDYSLAAGSGLLNARKLRWSDSALELAGIREGQLSPLLSPAAKQGSLKPDVAHRLGIPESTPVVMGSSDAVNSSVGAGAVSASQATCMIGTSGALRVISGRPVFDENGRTWCYAIDEKHWLVGGAINNGGIAVSWLKDSLGPVMPPDQSPGELSIEHILDLAGQVPAGAEGVVCLPFFAGERSPNWNLNARGVFFGVTLEHDIRHLSRSILEGIGFRFRSLQDALAGIGLDIRQILASGGFAKSELWLQIVTDALNREMTVPRWSETSALGAAFWAMLGAGGLDRIEDAGDLVEQGKTYRPIPENAALYDQIYTVYLRIYQALLPAFDEAALLSGC